MVEPLPVREWVPLSEILKYGKRGDTMTKMGLVAMEKTGTIEKRENPDTKEIEYRITERGKKAGLSFKLAHDV